VFQRLVYEVFVEKKNMEFGNGSVVSLAWRKIHVLHASARGLQSGPETFDWTPDRRIASSAAAF
jgi:hypothetical protein